MTKERKQQILQRLESFAKIEHKATDEIGFIAMVFSVDRRTAEKWIKAAKASREVSGG